MDPGYSSTIRVANAPCSWGTLEFKGLGGAQVDCTVMLQELAETGYAGTELGDWGYMPVEAAALKRLLGRSDLSLRGAFVPVALSDLDRHNIGVGKAVRTANLLAAAGDPADPPFLVLADENAANPERVQHAGRITLEQGMTLDQWEIFVKGAHLVASAVREESGLKTVFHHHCAGFVETPKRLITSFRKQTRNLLDSCWIRDISCMELEDGMLTFRRYSTGMLTVSGMCISRTVNRTLQKQHDSRDGTILRPSERVFFAS